MPTFGQVELDSLVNIDTTERSASTNCFFDVPEFPTGKNGLELFVAQNLKVPESFKGKGVVVVRFLVTKTGALNDIVIIKSLTTACDNEVIRLFKSMPLWKPGGPEYRKDDMLTYCRIYIKKGKGSIYARRSKSNFN